MNKIIRYIQNYLICALPFVIGCMVWETIQPDIQFGKSSSIIAKVLWELLSWNLMLWFAFLVLFLISLVAISSVREKTLRRLANLHERDEREQYITGKAARAAYISTLSFLILFLFAKKVPMLRYDIGFDIQKSKKEGKIVGLKQNESAMKAGLREGDEFTHLSYDYGNTKVAMQIILKTSQSITYSPSEPVQVLQYFLLAMKQISSACYSE